MSSILITGGCGFLGWNIARGLTQLGERVVCYDIKQPDPRLIQWQNDTTKIVEGDVKYFEQILGVIRDERVKKIVHAGAIVGYTSKVDEIIQYIRTNIEGTLNVLEATRVMDLDKIVFISSEEIYGTFQYESAKETHPVNPLGIYATTKCAAESLINLYYMEYGINCLILRTCWVYGPGLPRDRAPWFLIEKALKGEEAFLENGGDQKSDKTYVDDLVQGVRLALSNNKVKHRIFIVASGQVTTLGQMISLIKRIIPGARIGVGSGLLNNSQKVKMPQKGALDISRAREELGYQPQYNLEKGLGKYIRWLKNYL